MPFLLGLQTCTWLNSRLSMVVSLASAVRAEDFAIHDGDTVVFLGDSITAVRVYSKIIENYTLLRFPSRKVRFINVGHGGDTAAGGLKRLDRDVFANHATLLTVAYGINDIGWGTKADEEHKQLYLASIRGIVEACRKHGVRVYICSAPVTAEDPDKADNGFLQKMCDEAMALSRSLGGGAIDVQRSMCGFSERSERPTKGRRTRPSATRCTPPTASISMIWANWRWGLPS